jgi:DNA-binding NtrC family response regulator
MIRLEWKLRLKAKNKDMRKVLFIDDDGFARDFVRMSAKAYSVDFEIDTAASAMEAIEKLNSTSYDAVIIDIVLPDLQGTVLADKIHEAFPQIPMTFLTAYDSTIAANMSVTYPMDYWDKAQKMASFESMKECILKLLDGRSCDGLKMLVDSNAIGTGKIILPKGITDNLYGTDDSNRASK